MADASDPSLPPNSPDGSSPDPDRSSGEAFREEHEHAGEPNGGHRRGSHRGGLHADRRHSNGGHSHGREAGTGRLIGAILLNALITIAEFVAGLWTGSLALMADAAHNLSDAASMGVTLAARLIARRDSDRERTFGYRRAEVVGAFINLVTLVVIALFLLKETVVRALNPQPVDGEVMMLVAGIALAGNLLTAWLLFRGSKHSLNVRSAFLHIVADAMASAGVLAGGALVTLYGWTWVDPAVTALISLYILAHSYRMLRSTIRILMDAAPPDFDFDAMVQHVETVDGVVDVHHVHVWQLDEDRTAVEAHVVIGRADLAAMESIKQEVKARLQREFNVEHSTLEFEVKRCTGPAADVIPSG